MLGGFLAQLQPHRLFKVYIIVTDTQWNIWCLQEATTSEWDAETGEMLVIFAIFKKKATRWPATKVFTQREEINKNSFRRFKIIGMNWQMEAKNKKKAEVYGVLHCTKREQFFLKSS
jgi:hypothetical protein